MFVPVVQLLSRQAISGRWLPPSRSTAITPAPFSMTTGPGW
jgi:hypothetical protein